MRTLLAVTLSILPLVQAQDSRLLKSVEPSYGKYSEDLVTDFDIATASVTMTVTSDGKPFTLDISSVPLPMAVVMALKEYEFRPEGVVPHGRPISEGDTYQVTLNVPVRQSKGSARQSYPRMPQGVARGNLIKQVRPEYSEYARHNRIQGRITLEAVITKQGDAESLKTSNGPFVLIEAAYEAVKQWQYKPFLLNREPVDVLTVIEVNFTLN